MTGNAAVPVIPAGYTKNIQILNPSYTIAPYKDYSKVYEDVEGFPGTDALTQLKPSVATGVVIGIGILVLSHIGL